MPKPAAPRLATDRLVGAAEIAHLLDISRAGAYLLVRSGQLGQVVHVGSPDAQRATPRVWLSGVQAWLDGRAQGGAA